MKSKRVLIVEDNDLNRKLFENLIGQLWGYESASNGKEAVEKVKQSDFDLILMDIQMPEMDGISAMKEIKLLGKTNPPIVAITAFADNGDRDTFLKQGFDEFIAKPIRPREFLEVLERMIQGGRLESANPSEEIAEMDKILDLSVVKQLMKYNSPKIIRSVFEDFIRESYRLINESQAQVKANDFEELAKTIHIIKGNSGTLGANRIYTQAFNIEKQLKDNLTINFEEKIQNLENEIRSFQDFLKEESNFTP
ncbi:MAG: Hpt domain-containing response regulator [Bacteroidota bacterium]